MLVGCFVLWGLWVSRNDAKYKGSPINPNRIVNDVMYWVSVLLEDCVFKIGPTFLEQIMLDALHLPIMVKKHNMGKWVVWSPPEQHKLKLYTVGSCVNGMCAGGAVVRDDNGNFVMDFSFSIGPGSNSYAEAYALYLSLKACRKHSLFPDIIELDSKFLVMCLNVICDPPIHLAYVVDKCLNLVSKDTIIKHVFRDANFLADSLSKHGHKVDGIKRFSEVKDLPNSCMEAFVADFMGLANYRSS